MTMGTCVRGDGSDKRAIRCLFSAKKKERRKEREKKKLKKKVVGVRLNGGRSGSPAIVACIVTCRGRGTTARCIVTVAWRPT